MTIRDFITDLATVRSVSPAPYVERHQARQVEDLHRGAILKAELLRVNDCLMRLAELCYAPSADGERDNIDPATGRIVIAKPWGFLVIECDEEQHSHYDPSCDPRRDFDTAAAIALGSGHKLRILRYNPDPYKVDGITRRTPKEERVRRLLEVLERPEPATQLERLFLFYNHCSRDTLPEIASNWSVEVKAVSGLA